MEFIFKPILLALDIGTDWWNGYGYLQITNSSTNFSSNSSSELLPEDEGKHTIDYRTAGLITIFIPWLPGLFYAIVLGFFWSGDDTRTRSDPDTATEPDPSPTWSWKKLFVSTSTIPLAPIVPIVAILMAAFSMSKEYDPVKFKNFISLCCLLESAMESSIQLCWQGIITIKEGVQVNINQRGCPST